MAALSKVGVSFTQQQKDQIATLVQSGDVLGAQKIILAELNKEFGGVAAAAATAGDKAAVAFGNLKETVGTALLPLLDGVASVFTGVIAPAAGQGCGSPHDNDDATGLLGGRRAETAGQGCH